jgi:hypothetical protein
MQGIPTGTSLPPHLQALMLLALLTGEFLVTSVMKSVVSGIEFESTIASQAPCCLIIVFDNKFN